jgi:Domain of unknown function (DUF4499)
VPGTDPTPTFRRPRAGWFATLDGGIALLIVFTLSRATRDRLARVVPLPPRRALVALLAATAVIHVGEAAYAGRTARRRGLPGRPWALQTLAVGFPSLLELRKLRAASG